MNIELTGSSRAYSSASVISRRAMLCQTLLILAGGSVVSESIGSMIYLVCSFLQCNCFFVSFVFSNFCISVIHTRWIDSFILARGPDNCGHGDGVSAF